MCLALLFFCLPAHTVEAEAHSMIGLLKLPGVFGTDECSAHPARPVPLFATPEAGTRVGEIQVVRGGHEGNCASREVRVRLAGGGDRELPTLEHGYELRSVVVRRRVGSSFEIALAGGTAWVRARDAGDFLPVPQLFADQMLYLTRHAPRPRIFEDREPEVELVRTETVGGKLHLLVRVLPKNPCTDESVEGGGTTLTVPFHGNGKLPSVWFHARGC